MEIDQLGGWPTWQSFIYARKPAAVGAGLLPCSPYAEPGRAASHLGGARPRALVCSRRNRLGRVSLLLAIPAFELIIVYVLQAGLTILALALQNWRLAAVAALASGEATPGTASLPWQFSILDMLFLTAVVAWLCAMSTERRRPSGRVGPCCWRKDQSQPG